MTLQETLLTVQHPPTPACCKSCEHIEYDDDPPYMSHAYCGLGLWLPTRKQACKKQERRDQPCRYT